MRRSEMLASSLPPSRARPGRNRGAAVQDCRRKQFALVVPRRSGLSVAESARRHCRLRHSREGHAQRRAPVARNGRSTTSWTLVAPAVGLDDHSILEQPPHSPPGLRRPSGAATSTAGVKLGRDPLQRLERECAREVDVPASRACPDAERVHRRHELHPVDRRRGPPCSPGITARGRPGEERPRPRAARRSRSPHPLRRAGAPGARRRAESRSLPRPGHEPGRPAVAVKTPTNSSTVATRAPEKPPQGVRARRACCVPRTTASGYASPTRIGGGCCSGAAAPRQAPRGTCSDKSGRSQC